MRVEQHSLFGQRTDIIIAAVCVCVVASVCFSHTFVVLDLSPRGPGLCDSAVHIRV